MTTQKLVRTSERTSFNRCRWAWDLSFNKKLRQRRDAPVLRFGTLCHEALAAYYKVGKKRGPHPAKTFLQVYERDVRESGEFAILAGWDDEGNPHWEDSDWVDAKELGVELMEQYVEFYGGDPEWEVLAVEVPFKVPVHNPRTGRFMFYYVGILDLVIRHMPTGRVWIWDHKTTKAIDLTALGLNEQAGSYWTFGVEWLVDQGLIDSKVFDDLSGLTFNFIRRARRDPRPHNELGQALNKDGSVSKRQPSKIFHREPTYRAEYDREQVRRRAMNDFREMEMVRNGDLATKKSPSAWHCKGCAWLDVCELHETGADWEMMLDGTTEGWNPYSEHEIRDAELR